MNPRFNHWTPVFVPADTSQSYSPSQVSRTVRHKSVAQSVTSRSHSPSQVSRTVRHKSVQQSVTSQSHSPSQVSRTVRLALNLRVVAKAPPPPGRPPYRPPPLDTLVARRPMGAAWALSTGQPQHAAAAHARGALRLRESPWLRAMRPFRPSPLDTQVARPFAAERAALRIPCKSRRGREGAS